MSLIVKSGIRDYVKRHELSISEDAMPHIEMQVIGLIDLAMGRARMNQRKTVKARDI